jgi:hypothetical protein
MRYGRDPYRGLGQADAQSQILKLPTEAEEMARDARDRVMSELSPMVLATTGVAVGVLAGAAGGLMKSAVLGALAGGVGGFLASRWLWDRLATATAAPVVPTEAPSGLHGILAVL